MSFGPRQPNQELPRFFKGDKHDTVWNQDLYWIKRCERERKELRATELCPDAAASKHVKPELVRTSFGYTGTIDMADPAPVEPLPRAAASTAWSVGGSSRVSSRASVRTSRSAAVGTPVTCPTCRSCVTCAACDTCRRRLELSRSGRSVATSELSTSRIANLFDVVKNEREQRLRAEERMAALQKELAEVRALGATIAAAVPPAPLPVFKLDD